MSLSKSLLAPIAAVLLLVGCGGPGAPGDRTEPTTDHAEAQRAARAQVEAELRANREKSLDVAVDRWMAAHRTT